ncbi:Threonine synthase [bioreactor metagenome]|uniref:threonine synthase n=1 Tax=bioreactor metagenome TaxID=1076179 RepID=A0A644TQW6_9ZZZZ|nr:threonine synthase [Negativicutes bacterium]
MSYTCYQCGKTYREDQLILECTCGGYLKAPERAIRKQDIITQDPTLWRYRKALPIGENDPVISLGEGLTPLVKTNFGGLFFKADSLMPTGSFKDRGAALVISHLKKLGIKKVINDSSGNSAAAYAAYCAAAGLECHIFTPASTSVGKLVQIQMYGAKVTKVAGARDQVTLAAKAEAEKQVGQAVYAGHNTHPLFPEGCKTVAYEIWEQLGWGVPDNIVVPFGGGSAMLGMYKGFRELVSVGEIPHMPRIFVIQAHSCNPLYSLFVGKEESAQCVPGLAEGISIAKPIKKVEAIAAVRQTGGTVEEVSEGEIIEALREASRAGFYVEPTTAATVAGALRLQKTGVIRSAEKTVVLLTGNGLKATDKIGQAMGLV